MSPPFNVVGIRHVAGRHLMQEDADLYFHSLQHEALVGSLTEDGPSGYLPVYGIPAGGVFARVDDNTGNYGIAEYLGADAMFGRYEQGYVWPQDRKSKLVPTGAPPSALISAGTPKAGTGPGGMRAGSDGRRPGVRPWQDKVTAKYAKDGEIEYIGPDEEKLADPYVIVLRGSGYGAESTVRDHFAFAGHHWHISDHRGPPTGYPSPNDLRSTRIYDVNPDGTPSADTTDPSGRFKRGYNAGIDKLIVVHKQVGGCAGGDPEDMTLALNFASNTGQGHGLVEMKSSAPFEPIAGARTTSSGSTHTPEKLLAFLSYEMGGPLTAGHPKADKHFTGVNGDGIRSNSMHIHINAKYSNDGVKFDGRDHIHPADEPFVAAGIIPVRVYHYWNPFLPDPHKCKDQIGGWDYWTKINRVPVRDDPGKPGDPGGDKGGDPGGVKTPTEPDGQAKPDPGGGKMIKLPPPPVDYSPIEERVPSIEGQPEPGNGEDPDDSTPGIAKGPVTGDGHTDFPGGGYSDNQPSYSLADLEGIDDPEKLAAEIEYRAEKYNEWSAENRVRHVTGFGWSDHMKSPVVSHLGYFFRQINPEPKRGLSGLARNLPKYTKHPVFKHRGRAEPLYERGTADGVGMLYPPEYERWQLRHDYPDYKKPTETSEHWLGFYPGVGQAFGKLSSDKGEVVDGHRIFQDGNVLTHRGVDTAGALDLDKSFEFETPLGLPNLTTTQRDALAAAYAGLTIFNTTTGNVESYDGSAWDTLTNTAGSGAVWQSVVITAAQIAALGAATTGQLVLHTELAATEIIAYGIRLTEAVVDLKELHVSVGISSAGDLAPDYDLGADAGRSVDDGEVTYQDPPYVNFGGGTSVDVYFETDGVETLDAISAGEVTVYFKTQAMD